MSLLSLSLSSHANWIFLSLPTTNIVFFTLVSLNFGDPISYCQKLFLILIFSPWLSLCVQTKTLNVSSSPFLPKTLYLNPISSLTSHQFDLLSTLTLRTPHHLLLCLFFFLYPGSLRKTMKLNALKMLTMLRYISFLHPFFLFVWLLALILSFLEHYVSLVVAVFIFLFKKISKILLKFSTMLQKKKLQKFYF